MEQKPTKQTGYATSAQVQRPGRRIQVILWSLWTACVVGAGYLSWHADAAAHRPFNALALVIHTVTVGMIGLVVLTVIEMRLEPWRFRE